MGYEPLFSKTDAKAFLYRWEDVLVLVQAFPEDYRTNKSCFKDEFGREFTGNQLLSVVGIK